MNVYINAIELSHPSGTHEHITHVWWSETSKTYQPGQKHMTVQQAVDWLGKPDNTAQVYNPTTGGTVAVNVVPKHPAGGYLRTSPDDTKRDNLLSLPRGRR